MLHRDILIAHLLCFIFRMDQDIIQILSDIDLTSLYFRTLLQHLFHTIDNERSLISHFFK